MNADDLSGVCPICRDAHVGLSCTALMPFSIVLLEIDDCTSADAVRKVEAAYLRAAKEMVQRRLN